MVVQLIVMEGTTSEVSPGIITEINPDNKGHLEPGVTQTMAYKLGHQMVYRSNIGEPSITETVPLGDPKMVSKLVTSLITTASM